MLVRQRIEEKMEAEEEGRERLTVEPSSWMELEVDKSTVTRRTVEMAPEAPQPPVNRNIEPKTKKSELEEYVDSEVAGSGITEHFRV